MGLKRGRPKSERSLLERLLDNTTVDGPNDCWFYQGAKNNIGYGMIRDEKKMRTAHRVSFEEHNNTVIPDDKIVMHLCGNRHCVNPNHLQLASRKDVSELCIKTGKSMFFGVPYGVPPRLGKKSPRAICSVCGNEHATNVLKRWHDDKCKHKPNE